MSHARKVFAVALLLALAWVVAPVAEAQPPIRIGETLGHSPRPGIEAAGMALALAEPRGPLMCLDRHGFGCYGIDCYRIRSRVRPQDHTRA